MINGFATAAATRSYVEKHGLLAGNNIGTEGLTVSQAGFGCYRVSAGVAHHELALGMALCKGINLIDTSATYGDGGSEILVGQVLQKLIDSGDLKKTVDEAFAHYERLAGSASPHQRADGGRRYPETSLAQPRNL